MMNYLMMVFREILYLGMISGIIIVLILLMKKIFGKLMSPKWHYYIWILLVIRLIVPVMPESSFSALNLYYYSVDRFGIGTNGNQEPSSGNLSNGVFDDSKTPGNGSNISNSPNTNNGKSGTTLEHTNTGQSRNQHNFSTMMMLTYVWLSGMAMLILYTIAINIAFYRKVAREYKQCSNQRANLLLKQCREIAGIKSNIVLYTTSSPRTPALYSLFHTRILACEGYLEKLSDKELKYVFLHELSHYKRKDILINWVLTLLQVVYFFQPLIWYAFHKMHEECEISCDAEALKYLEEEEYESYGSTMIKLIRLFSESNFIPVTAGLWKHKSNYKRRIIMINKFKKYKWPNHLLTMILVLMVGLIGLTGCKKAEVYAGSNSPDNNQVKEVALIGTPTPALTQKPQSGDNSANPTVTKAPDLGKSDQEKADQEKADQEKNNQEGQSFFGNWVISKVIAYGPVGTYSKEEAQLLIGKSMSFSKKSATCFGEDASYINDTVKNPTYEVTTMNKEDYMSYYRMSFELLGIKGDSVKEVTVSGSEGNGCVFLVKNENSLIVIGGGVYFELLRKAS